MHNRGWNGVHIVVDFHSVLANLAHALILKSGGPPPYQEDITHYLHPLFNGIRETLKDPHDLYAIMPPILHAPEAMAGMADSGYYITVASDSPEETREANINWLKWWGIPFDRYVQAEDKCIAGGHMLVDDRTRNVERYARRVGPAILFTQPWNLGWTPPLTSHPLVRTVGWQRTLEQIRKWSYREGRVPFLPTNDV